MEIYQTHLTHIKQLIQDRINNSEVIENNSKEIFKKSIKSESEFLNKLYQNLNSIPPAKIYTIQPTVEREIPVENLTNLEWLVCKKIITKVLPRLSQQEDGTYTYTEKSEWTLRLEPHEYEALRELYGKL